MKKITFLFILLTVSLGFSQQVVMEDFEGTPPTFNGFEGLGGTSITTDPVNGSNTAGQIISSSAGNPWQGAELITQSGMIDLSSDITVNVDVYSTSAFDCFAKVEDKVNTVASPASATATAHTGSGWETLTFTFNQSLDGTVPASGTYSQIAFFPNWNIGGNTWNNPAADFTIYVDDITAEQASFPESCNDGIQNQDETGVDCGGVCPACPVPPGTGAPTPPARSGGNVISFFSDAYSDVTVDSFDAGFCGTPSVSDVVVDGNPTKLFNGQACQGIDFTNNRIDASAFSHFHFDFYTDEADVTGKVFNFKLVDFAGGGSEATSIEININDGTTPAVVTGSWVSVDIDLNSGDPVIGGTGLTRSDLAQIVISSNLTNVWYDNVYFHNDIVLGIDDNELASFNLYPNPAQNAWTVKSANQNISSIQVFDMLGKNVLNLSPGDREARIDASGLARGLYFAQVSTDSGTSTLKLIKE